jgi:hypothetical protein
MLLPLKGQMLLLLSEFGRNDLASIKNFCLLIETAMA